MKKGFTLVELLVTIAIIAAISVVAGLNLFGRRNTSDLNNTALQIVVTLRQAQSDSMAQSQSTSWGVHFDNATSTRPYFALFKTSWSAANMVGSRNVLPASICYSGMASGSSLDVTFNQISGTPSSTANSIILNIKSKSCGGGVDAWTATTALPSASANHSSVLNNGYIYVIGGCGAVSCPTPVIYAPINSNNSIGNWITTAALPTGLSFHSSVVNGGYIYTIGGADINGNVTSTVLYASIGSNNSVGNWAMTASLPSVLKQHSSVVNKGYIYTLGGYSSPNFTSTVLYAPVNVGGTIGSWATTTPLLSTLGDFSAVVNNGYIYVTGGIDNSLQFVSTVYYAPINATGSIGSWSATTALPNPTRGHSSVVYNGYIYVIGGNISGGLTPAVYYAPINSTGSIGAWTATTPLPDGVYYHTSVMNNGYIYTIGGTNSGGPITSTITNAKISGAVITIGSQGAISYQ